MNWRSCDDLGYYWAAPGSDLPGKQHFLPQPAPDQGPLKQNYLAPEDVKLEDKDLPDRHPYPMATIHLMNTAEVGNWRRPERGSTLILGSAANMADTHRSCWASTTVNLTDMEMLVTLGRPELGTSSRR